MDGTATFGASGRVLVLGLGNILLGDEGLGVRAAERLAARYVLPDGVDVVDGGTSGYDLIDILAGRDRVIVLDAVDGEGGPGTLVRLHASAVPVGWQAKQSHHQLGLADVLAALTLLEQAPRALTVIGLVPQDLDLGLDLSLTIAARLDDLVDAAVAELARLGFAPSGRPDEPLTVSTDGPEACTSCLSVRA